MERDRVDGDRADDAEAVAQVIESWRCALAARDAGGILGLWDRAFPQLRYLPTERPRFLVTWDEIVAYVQRMCMGSPVKELVVDELTVDVLGPDDAFAFCYVTQVSDARGEERRWHGRLQFSLRRLTDGWRIVRYEDSTDLTEAGAFACRLHAGIRHRLTDAIRAGDVTRALALIDDLAKPPHFASADAMDDSADSARR
jgi:ketosteroid isomerase-like protein